MSGSTFDYVQFRLDDPINDLRGRLILNNMSHAEAKNLFDETEDSNPEIYNAIYGLRHCVNFWRIDAKTWDPEKKQYRSSTKEEVDAHNAEHVFDHDEDEVKIFKEAIASLEKSKAYLDAIDLYLSGDIDELTMMKEIDDFNESH